MRRQYLFLSLYWNFCGRPSLPILNLFICWIRQPWGKTEVMSYFLFFLFEFLLYLFYFGFDPCIRRVRSGNKVCVREGKRKRGRDGKTRTPTVYKEIFSNSKNQKTFFAGLKLNVVIKRNKGTTRPSTTFSSLDRDTSFRPGTSNVETPRNWVLRLPPIFGAIFSAPVLASTRFLFLPATTQCCVAQ